MAATKTRTQDAWGNPWGKALPRNMERPLTRYGETRRCAARETEGPYAGLRCWTVLNQYNPGPECLRHKPQEDTPDPAA